VFLRALCGLRVLFFDAGLRLDLAVERGVIVELKAVETLLSIHEAQVLTFLNLSGLRIALLINFNSIRLKDGLHRFVRSPIEKEETRRPPRPRRKKNWTHRCPIGLCEFLRALCGLRVLFFAEQPRLIVARAIRYFDP
jgi:hypothetical protein